MRNKHKSALRGIGLQFFAESQPRRYFQLVQEERSADITIYGDITSWEWLESDVSSYTLSRQIQGLDVDTINVHINSYGGEVAEGLAIHNALKNHKATVKTYCDGFACSAASVVFMAGDERIMNSASLLMIHNAWSFAQGNAEQLRKAADDLEVISKTASNVYRARMTISDEKLDELLDNETWITPQDAVAWGFATSILEETQPGVPSQSAQCIAVNAILTTQTMRTLLGGFSEAQPPAGSPPPAPQDPPPAGDPPPQEKTLSTFFDALCKGGKE